jgi:hypothetical protein
MNPQLSRASQPLRDRGWQRTARSRRATTHARRPVVDLHIASRVQVKNLGASALALRARHAWALVPFRQIRAVPWMSSLLIETSRDALRLLMAVGALETVGAVARPRNRGQQVVAQQSTQHNLCGAAYAVGGRAPRPRP